MILPVNHLIALACIGALKVLLFTEVERWVSKPETIYTTGISCKVFLVYFAILQPCEP
jgi:hypothetical protein